MRLFISLILIHGFLSSSSAVAQNKAARCHEYSHFLKTLNVKFQERLLGRGIDGTHAVIELFVSKEGTWTILQTRIFQSGTKWACIIDAGRSWGSGPSGRETQPEL